MGRLDGKVAIITGAARGQGEAEARLFAEEGAKVVLGDLLDAEGEVVAKEIGDAALYLHLDVREEADWANAVATCVSHFGNPTVLINNAGIMPVGMIVDTDLATFRNCLDTNLVGAFLGIRAVVGPMTEAGGGSIVNISSTNGLAGGVALSAYTSSKFGNRGLAKAAAMELGHQGIRVNSIHPGAVNTAMQHDPAFAHVDKSAFYAGLPIPRTGEPIDLARVVLFLASDDAAYCTGAEFVADGGMLAGPMF